MPYRILVVDDEPDLELLMRQNFRRKIRANELEFVFANNGRHALEKLKEDSSIDVMFSDINMPEMDGLTLLDNVMGSYPLIKAIMISAYGDMANIRTAMNNGAFDFVNKPIDFTDLEATLSKTLQEVQAVKEAAKSKEQLISIKRELQIGRQIQESFLPFALPKHPGYEFAGLFIPAKEVAGDFFDIFRIPGADTIALVIGDVCGKGIGPALFMTLVRTLLHSLAEYAANPDNQSANAVQLAHNYIMENHESANMFATLFYAELNPATGKIRYINCGHCSPVILTPAGVREEMPPNGPVIGMFPHEGFTYHEASINPGEVFFAYTDGVTDANDPANEQFSEEKVESLLAEGWSGSAQAILDRFKDALTSHIATAEQFDDITMIAARRDA